MMMPSIFGENLFNDWMDFSFPDIDKKLYGKRADRMMKTDVKEKNGTYIRRERYAGNMSRSFYVGEDITETDIHAKFENGILMLDIPKKEEKKPVDEKRYVTIEG